MSINMYIFVIHFLIGPVSSTRGTRSQFTFYFVNNSAGVGGDIIIVWGTSSISFRSRLEFLDSFKNMSNVSQTGLSLISSDPSRVCLCTTTGIPNCTILSDSISKPIFPDQAVILTAVVYSRARFWNSYWTSVCTIS